MQGNSHMTWSKAMELLKVTKDKVESRERWVKVS